LQRRSSSSSPGCGRGPASSGRLGGFHPADGQSPGKRPFWVLGEGLHARRHRRKRRGRGVVGLGRGRRGMGGVAPAHVRLPCDVEPGRRGSSPGSGGGGGIVGSPGPASKPAAMRPWGEEGGKSFGGSERSEMAIGMASPLRGVRLICNRIEGGAAGRARPRAPADAKVGEGDRRGGQGRPGAWRRTRRRRTPARHGHRRGGSRRTFARVCCDPTDRCRTSQTRRSSTRRSAACPSTRSVPRDARGRMSEAVGVLVHDVRACRACEARRTVSSKPSLGGSSWRPWGTALTQLDGGVPGAGRPFALARTSGDESS